MPRKAEEVILELEMKRKMRKQLREVRLQRLNEADFSTPFKDIFQALRLAAMDISNSLRLAIGMILTFDSEKMKKKIAAFDERRQKINAEWKPIMDRADQAIASTDPILAMAIMGPSNFLALKGMSAGIDAGKTAIEIATATNFDSLVNSWDVKIDLNQSVQQFFQKWDKRENEREEREAQRDVDTGKVKPGKSLLSRLSNLFSEGAQPYSILREQAETPPKAQPELSKDEIIDMFIKATGMDKKFKELLDEQKKNLKDTIPPLLEDLEPMVAVSNMLAATDIESFKKAVQQAKGINPKLKEEPFKKFTDQVESETQKILKDPKAVEDAKKKLAKGKELSPEDLQKGIEKSVFDTLKSQFDKQTAQTIKKVVDTTKYAIDNLKIDDKIIKSMEESPDAELKEIAQIYKKLLATYDTISKDYESKAKSKVA